MKADVYNKNADEQLREIMRELMFKLYDGRSFKVRNLLKKFRIELARRGIEVPNVTKQYNILYSITGRLEKDGLLKDIKYGVFYISSDGVEDYSEEVPEEYDDMAETDEPDCSGMNVIGDGEGTVYVYYYATYEQLAKLKNEERFPCKIGYTWKGTASRLGPKTDIPEPKILALEIRTNNPKEIERILHELLKAKGLHIDMDQREWFLTTPEEVLQLYTGISRLVA